MKKVGIIIAVIVGIIALWVGLTYNSLVTKQEDMKRAWAQVENVCQRRADLVPNLVSLVQSYSEYEQSTVIAITEARNKAKAATVNTEVFNEDELTKYYEAYKELGETMNQALVTVENYPDLKANESYLSLQAQLSGSENRIKTERERFNEAGKVYNQSVRRFPSNLIAKLFGFKIQPYFEATVENADKAPKTF